MKLGLALIVTLVLVASHVEMSQGSPRTAPVEPSLREAAPAEEIIMRGASERKPSEEEARYDFVIFSRWHTARIFEVSLNKMSCQI